MGQVEKEVVRAASGVSLWMVNGIAEGAEILETDLELANMRPAERFIFLLRVEPNVGDPTSFFVAKTDHVNSLGKECARQVRPVLLGGVVHGLPGQTKRRSEELMSEVAVDTHACGGDCCLSLDPCVIIEPRKKL